MENIFYKRDRFMQLHIQHNNPFGRLIDSHNAKHYQKSIQ
jgi:hypothetical protein